MESRESYKQIFKSTSIVGGAQVLNIAISIIRTKIIALLLGPNGVGIAGIFQNIVDLIRNGTGLGINFSGVKKVAENNTDPKSIAKTILVVKRWEFSTGLLGMLITLLFCRSLSVYSFGNTINTISIALISVILLINAVTAGQLTILQGLRRIGEMTKATLIGSALGTVISLPLFWWIGLSAIVPAMILSAIISLIVSWYFSKNIVTTEVNLSLKETFHDGLEMAKLGFFIVINGCIATGSMYIIRMFIRSNMGLDSVGFFQAIWTISTLYINILLNAMLADYFPRLSKIYHNKSKANQLINEQLKMTLLVGAPMLMGMIAFAPLVLKILYSAEFFNAIPALKWQIASLFLTLVGWPLGVVYLSFNKGSYAIMSEVLRQAVYICFIYFYWHKLSFEVLGIGFFVANCIWVVFIIFSVRRITSFSFSLSNFGYIALLGGAIISVLCTSLLLNGNMQYFINSFIILSITAFCLYKLDNLLNIKQWFQSKKN